MIYCLRSFYVKGQICLRINHVAYHDIYVCKRAQIAWCKIVYILILRSILFYRFVWSYSISHVVIWPDETYKVQLTTIIDSFLFYPIAWIIKFTSINWNNNIFNGNFDTALYSIFCIFYHRSARYYTVKTSDILRSRYVYCTFLIDQYGLSHSTRYE